MTVWGNVRIALRALRINKLRSALTMLGVIIGVGAVITMVAVGGGAEARVAEQIQSLGSNLLIVLSGSVTSGGVHIGSGSQLTLTVDDAAAIGREVPSVEAAAATVRGVAQVVVGNQNWSTVIQGVTPDYLVARDWGMASGDAFTDQDVEGATKVALLGQTVADQLFGGEDPVGQLIRIKNVPFAVVGVLDRKGQSTMGQDQDDTVLIPLSTAMKKVLGTSQANARAIGAILVKARSPEALAEAQRDVAALLRQRHHLQPGQEDDFTIRNLAEILESQQAASRVLAWLLAAIASVSLLVGGIGIMNIMLVSVTERTREIGLRMAIGARGRDVLAQFLVEAITVALIGGGIGVAAGVASAIAISAIAGWQTVIRPEAVVLAVGFSGAVGVFFGFYPARKAARLDPIEALRYE